MLDVYLFIGFQTNPPFLEQLSNVNPHLKRLLLNDKAKSNLILITHKEKKYLGRLLKNNFRFNSLFTIQSNIYSIVRRMLPNWEHEEPSLFIFPLTLDEFTRIDG